MRTFHFRDPRKTPSLRAVLECAYRKPEDNRPGPTSLEIEKYTREKGHPTVRPAADVSEIRAWAETYLQDGFQVYFVPPAKYIGQTENKNKVYQFVVYRYTDPRAEACREKEMMKNRKAA
jgi:hypothetical protein